VKDHLLQLDDVELRYADKIVVSGVRLELRRGSWVALVGPNASGKTTLLRSVAGRLPPARGFVRIAGKSLYPLRDWHEQLPGCAAVPEELPSFLTVRQSLEIHAAAHGIGAVPDHSLALFRELGLASTEGELIGHLSLGTRQKLAVVLALLTSPTLLLLDEVFNGLDVRSALILKRHLREQVERDGLSILLATHALDLVKDYCDGLALIDAGRLIRCWDAVALRGFGSTAELELALAGALAPAGGH